MRPCLHDNNRYSVWHAALSAWRIGSVRRLGAVTDTVFIAFESERPSSSPEEEEVPLAYLSLAAEVNLTGGVNEEPPGGEEPPSVNPREGEPIQDSLDDEQGVGGQPGQERDNNTGASGEQDDFLLRADVNGEIHPRLSPLTMTDGQCTILGTTELAGWLHDSAESRNRQNRTVSASHDGEEEEATSEGTTQETAAAQKKEELVLLQDESTSDDKAISRETSGLNADAPADVNKKKGAGSEESNDPESANKKAAEDASVPTVASPLRDVATTEDSNPKAYDGAKAAMERPREAALADALLRGDVSMAQRLMDELYEDDSPESADAETKMLSTVPNSKLEIESDSENEEAQTQGSVNSISKSPSAEEDQREESPPDASNTDLQMMIENYLSA